MFDPIAPEAPANPVLPQVKTLTGMELAKLYQFIKVLEPWCKEVKSYAMMKAGKESGYLPGLKLVKGRTSRSWKDAEGAEDHYQKVLGEEAYNKKFRSVSQMETACKKAKVTFDEGLIHKSSGVSLVPEEDKRQAVKPGQEMFEPIK